MAAFRQCLLCLSLPLNIYVFFALLHLLMLLQSVRAADNTGGGVKGVMRSWREKLQLQCAGGYGLHIIDASFGSPLLAGDTIYKSNRDAPHTKLVLQQHCENRNACQVLVDPETFGILKSVGTTEPKLAVTFACLASAQKGFFGEAAAEDTIHATPITQGGWNVMIKSAKEQADITELRRSYVHLIDIDAECEDPLQISVPLHTLEAAENRCAETEHCTFLIVRPHKIELCASNTYVKPRRSSGAAIYVKAFKAFGSATRLFKLHPNVQSVCERHQLVAEAENVRNAEDAAEQCVAAGCDFFVMSTVNKIPGALSDFMNHVWLCKGSPIYIPFDGFVLGERRGASLAGEVPPLPSPNNRFQGLPYNALSREGACTKRCNRWLTKEFLYVYVQ